MHTHAMSARQVAAIALFCRKLATKLKSPTFYIKHEHLEGRT
jgi:hypothetical protein